MSSSSEWALRLYIGGQSPQSKRAVRNLNELVAQHLENSNADVAVLDVLEHPELARKENILALPTLIRESPDPRVLIIGDLSDIARVWEAVSDA